MEIILAQSTNGESHAVVKAVCDENEKILKITAESVGEAWCRFGTSGNYTITYGFNDYQEIDISSGNHYLVDGEIPEGLVKVTYGN